MLGEHDVGVSGYAAQLQWTVGDWVCLNTDRYLQSQVEQPLLAGKLIVISNSTSTLRKCILLLWVAGFATVATKLA